MAIEMSELLQLVVDEGVSDLHIEVDASPTVRLHGSLTPLEVAILGPVDTERLVKSITSDAQQQQIQEKGTVDFEHRK